MGKNVAVFVDVANIFYAAKSAGVDIDYVTLLKSATAGRDFVRAYAYTGLDPDNENQRNFHQFLARNQYKVVSKDIRKYGDGKVKANLDIELVVDLMKTARNLDVAVIVSGDGDFASAIRAVQEMGVRVEVISFRGNTSSDLIEAADLFTDITHIAKVDKGSTRSGRRVAGDDEDLSMTEVPEKQSEGTGRGRGRGRGRGGRYERDEAPIAARSSRGRSEVPAAPMGGAGLVALPGEKLSRAAASVEDAEEPEELEAGVVLEGEAAETEGEGDAPRRRRRRGGRGRGRGRRDELTAEEVAEGGLADAEGEIVDAIEAADEAADEADAEADAEGEVVEAPAAEPARTRSDRGRAPRTPSGDFATPFDDIEALAQPRAPRSTPFGSVWDQQLGAPTRPAASGLAPLPEDEEDLDEPEIPEYLLAERRAQGNRGGGNRGGGNRGGRNAAYAAAIERERYGGGRGGGTGGSGINRYGETRGGGSGASGGGGGGRSGGVSRGGGQPPRGPRQDRPAERFDRAPRSAGTSAEPWSEVPPELEELLLAQMAKSAPAGRPSASVTETPAQEAAPKRRTARKPAAAAADAPEAAPVEAAAEESPAAPKRRTTRKPAAPATTEAPGTVAEDAPATPKRSTRAKAAPTTAPEPAPAEAVAEEAPAAPKRRTTRKPAAATADAPQAAPVEAVAEEAPAAPKRRTTRKPAATPEG